MPKVNQETAEALTELIRKGLVKIVINEDGEVAFKLTASRLIKIEVRKNGSGLKFEYTEGAAPAEKQPNDIGG